jgi:hypothetical protein
VSVSKHTTYADGVKMATEVVALVRAEDEALPIDLERIKRWLEVRTKNDEVKVLQER